MTKSQKILFELIQVAIGSRKELGSTPSEKDWSAVYSLAESQNILGVGFGGIEKLPKHQFPNMYLLMDWLGQTEYCKTQYEEHKKAISDLAAFYQGHSIQLMLLKGYGLSLNYPSHEVRPTGDIDCYLYGRIDQADDLLEKELRIAVDRGNEHHSVFNYHGITVENHRTFSDQHNHKSNLRLEQLYQQMIAENNGVCIGDNIYTPSPTLNAIYLVRHAGEHFATEEITLRHVLDLGTFFVVHHDEIDWDRVLQVYKDESMIQFYDAIATICVRNLGMSEACFHGYTTNERLADRVLADIFSQKEALPMSIAGISGLDKLKYGIQKTARWWQNRWKYKMVYKESLWESFFTLATNRIKN